MGGLGKVQFCYFKFHLAGSIVASMPNFSFLEGVILTFSVGVGEWVGGVENCTIKLNSVPFKFELGLD